MGLNSSEHWFHLRNSNWLCFVFFQWLELLSGAAIIGVDPELLSCCSMGSKPVKQLGKGSWILGLAPSCIPRVMWELDAPAGGAVWGQALSTSYKSWGYQQPSVNIWTVLPTFPSSKYLQHRGCCPFPDTLHSSEYPGIPGRFQLAVMDGLMG